MSPKATYSAFYGTVAILFFLTILYFLPYLLHRTSYEVEFPKSSSLSNERKFPVERELSILKGRELLPFAKKGKVSISQIIEYTNRTALVNFWATWCPPCVEELPSLEFLNRQLNAFKEKRPLIITLSVDDRAEDINRFYKTLEFQPSLIVLHDVDGDLARGVGTVKFPETYWVNSSGITLHKWIGPQAWLSREVIEKLSPP